MSDVRRLPWLRRIGAWTLLDLVLPLSAFLLMSRLWHDRLWRHLGRHTSLEWNLSPGDENGTLWFWWWLGHSWDRGQALLFSDATCQPLGEPLELNFPNRIDAWLAQPLLDHMGLPAGYDTFLLLVPVMSCFGAWAFLRTLTRSRLAAAAAALVYGFTTYTVVEATDGRPVSSILMFAPLALAPWSMAHQARSLARRAVWSALAGALLALQAVAYIPYALFLALAFVASALAQALRWRSDQPRWHPLVQLALAGGIAALVTAPYLHELIIVRTGGLPGAALSPDQLVPRWDPGTLAELWQHLSAGGKAPTTPGARPPYFEAPYWIAVQGESMPWDYLWNAGSNQAHRPVATSGLFVACAVVAGLVARRARPAVVAALVLWLLTLGPHMVWQTDRAAAQLVLVAGRRVALPVGWLLDVAPQLDMYLRPYRLVPFLGLAAGAALVLSVEALRDHMVSAGGRRARLALLAGLLAAVPAGVGLVELARTPWSTWRLAHFGRHPFFDQLAHAPQDLVIAELPAGSGHMLGGLQAIHGKDRTEPLHDLNVASRSGAPEGPCYRSAFARGLWYLGRSDDTAQQAVERALQPDSLADAAADGITYVVLHPTLYQQLPQVDLAEVRERLDRALGPPLVRELALEVWQLPGTQGMPPS